jgi:cytochrome b561
VAANVSLVLVVVGWLLIIFTVLWNLGDPNPRTPPAEVLRQQHLFAAVLWIAILFLLGSQILAGLAFREAKRRSLLAFAVFVLPLMVFGVLAVIGGI